jgi:hypothetical protein
MGSRFVPVMSENVFKVSESSAVLPFKNKTTGFCLTNSISAHVLVVHKTALALF